MSLLEESKTYKPFLYPWAVDMVKKHEEIHWVEDEAELSEDVQDWRTKLNDEEKEFITHVLRLFTQSDVQVGANYHDFLIPKFPNSEYLKSLFSDFSAISYFPFIKLKYLSAKLAFLQQLINKN